MEKLATIQKLEEWIDSYLNFEKTPKKNIFWLDTMRFFCERFGFPQNFAPCFHVAGSKGKGSVSLFIASILDEAGFKTGLYTSPHIIDFIERISTPTGKFENDVYDRAVKEIMSGVQSIKTQELPAARPVTWFELVTLFAFLTFRQANVDYSVFEVGLGGRLDSTNVVNPLCSVITPIEREHTEYLGDTLEKIAFEKGGIIKKNVPVVISRQEKSVRKVFEKIAGEKDAKLIFFDDEIEDLEFEIKNRDKNWVMGVGFSSKIFKRRINADLQMLGRFQAENAALSALAVKSVIPEISEETIEKGISKARLQARFEVTKNPLAHGEESYLVLDGAHTVNSVRYTMETLENVFGKEKKSLLFACAADKDAKDIAPLFKGKFETVFLTRPGNVKHADLSLLATSFDCSEIAYDIDEDFESQIKKALENAWRKKSVLLVTGSFYLIAEVKKILATLEKDAL